MSCCKAKCYAQAQETRAMSSSVMMWEKKSWNNVLPNTRENSLSENIPVVTFLTQSSSNADVSNRLILILLALNHPAWPWLAAASQDHAEQFRGWRIKNEEWWNTPSWGAPNGTWNLQNTDGVIISQQLTHLSITNKQSGAYLMLLDGQTWSHIPTHTIPVCFLCGW